MAAPHLLSAQPTHPVGIKGPRASLLVELKREPRRTARELADRLGFSLNAVRHHLKDLEAAGFVVHERAVHGVGAPVFVYRLGPVAEALFPRRYEQTLTELLDDLAEREGRSAAVSLLESQFERLAERLARETAGLAPAERMAAVGRALADAGYMPEWEATSCSGTFTERNCAIESVAARFPEVCRAEARLLERVIGGTVERHSHILEGCSACQYKVRFADGEQA
jgi:predicted ArsR family transcriptional regulator